MPYENFPKDIPTETIDKCVADVMGKGHDKESAIAICYTSLVEGKMSSTKQGARHSAADQKMLQTIHDHAQALGADCPPGGVAAGKALLARARTYAARKGMDWHVGDSAMDIARAADILSQLAQLAMSETNEGDDPDDMADVVELAAIMQALMDFIAGERDEMVSLANQPPAGVQNAMDMGMNAMMSLTAKAVPSDKPGDYLVVEDKEKSTTWHLQVKEDGKPNHQLMGSAWAALHEGFRGNTYDGPNKQDAIAQLRKLYEAEKLPVPGEGKSVDTLIAFGGALKMADDGKFSGLLVKYSTEDDPDLTGDYFTKDTDFGIEDGSKTPIYFHHRLPMKTRDGGEIRIKSKVGDGVIRFREDGAYLEDAILFNRTEYEKAIRKQAAKGLLGLSSGTASHFVEREFTGKAYKITEWLLGIDASVTPTPAEPRTHIAPMKALPIPVLDFDIPDPEATTPEGAAKTAPVSGAAVNAGQVLDGANAPNTLEDFDMNEEQFNKLLGLVEAQGTAIKTQGDALAELKAKWNEPPDNKGGQMHDAKKGSQAPAVHKTPLGDDAFKAFGWYLKTGDPSGIRTGEAYEDMLQDRHSMKTTYALLESTQYQGQEAVPTEVVARIIEKRDTLSIMRAANAQVIPVGSNAVVLPIEKASPEIFVITSVNGSNTFDQTTVQPMDKLAGTIYLFTRSVPIDMQLLDDSVFGIEAWWSRRLGRAWGLTENNYFLMGTGSGQPQGAVFAGTTGVSAASAAAITAAEVVGLYESLGTEYQDNVIWAMAKATKKAVRALGAPQYGFAFVGNGGYNGGAGNTGHPQGKGWLVDPDTRTFTSAAMDALTASKKPISVMNAEAGYAIFERKGLTVFRDPYTLAANGEVNILAYFRETGGVTNADAIQNILTASA